MGSVTCSIHSAVAYANLLPTTVIDVMIDDVESENLSFDI
jgi:hypothetical protein